MYNATDSLSTSSASFFGETKQQLLSYPPMYRRLIAKAFYLIACRLGIFSEPNDNFMNSPESFTSLVNMKYANTDGNLKQWLAFGTTGLCCENSGYDLPNHSSFIENYEELSYDVNTFRFAAYNALSGEFEKTRVCNGHCSTCECYGGMPGECMSGELDERMAYYYAHLAKGDMKALESFSNTELEDICLYYMNEAIDYMGETMEIEEDVQKNALYCAVINHYALFPMITAPVTGIVYDDLYDDWCISTFYHPHFYQVASFLNDVKSGKYDARITEEECEMLKYYLQRHKEIYDFLVKTANELSEDGDVMYGCIPFLFSIGKDTTTNGAIFTFLENTTYELTKEVFLFKELINIVSECWSKYKHLILDTEVAVLN